VIALSLKEVDNYCFSIFHSEVTVKCFNLLVS